PEINEIEIGFKYKKLITERPDIRHGKGTSDEARPNFNMMYANYDKTDKNGEAAGFDEYFSYIQPKPVDPFDYMNKYLLDAGTWTFMGIKPDFSINIYLYYLLKKAEKEMPEGITIKDISNSVRF